MIKSLAEIIVFAMVVIVTLVFAQEAVAEGRLFGVSSDSSGGNNVLIEINTDTGEARPIGPVGIDGFVGLTANPKTGQLFGYSLFTGDIVEISRETGAGTAISKLAAQFGFGINGLGFESTTGNLLASNNGELVAIIPTTGEASTIGPIIIDGQSISDARGLAYDSNSNTLFGVNQGLYAIDASNGLGTRVGTSSTASLGSLAFDPVSNRLFSVDTLSDTLLAIHPATGNITEVGPLGIGRVFNLAFVPVPEPSSLFLLLVICSAMVSSRQK